MGNDNIDVGNETPARKPGQPDENPAQRGGSSGPQMGQSNSPKRERPRICGAMAQQGGDSGHGNDSAPQKLVQLVGCRDPKARHKPWVRPGSATVKR